jgi:hypothetical protein
MKRSSLLLSVIPLMSVVAAHGELIPRKPTVPATPPGAPPAAPPAPVKMSDEDLAKLKAQVEQLEKDVAKKRGGMHTTQLTILKDAMSGNDRAFNFWLDCKKEQDFEMKGKTTAEFAEWKREQIKTIGNNDAFCASLRLQLHYLRLIVLDSHVENAAQEAEVSSGAVEYVDSLTSFCDKEEVLAKSILGSIMDMSLDPEQTVKVSTLQESLKKSKEVSAALGGQVLDTIFARHLKLDGTVSLKNGAPTNPGNIDEIYDRLIIEPLRKKQDSAGIAAAWTKRIEQTAKVAKSTKVRELVERYEEVKVPSMKFAMYRDQWSAGQKKTAAASMMALIAANPTHKDSNRWMDQLKKLTEKEGEADVP